MISISPYSLPVIFAILAIALIITFFMIFSRATIADKKISKYRSSLYIGDIILFISMLYVDYFSKVRVRENMELNEHFDLIKGVLQVYYFENTGAVWGILKGQTSFLLIVTVIILGVCIYIFSKIPAQQKFAPFHVALSLVLSGAVGNMIDRIVKQSVTDFIYVSLIDFPIFNVADICVVVGVFLLMFLFIFVYKEQDLEFMKFISKKDGKIKKSEDVKAEK